MTIPEMIFTTKSASNETDLPFFSALPFLVTKADCEKWNPQYKALTALWERFCASERYAAEDGDPPVSERAVKTAFTLLWEAMKSLGDLPTDMLASGAIYGDGDGGLRTEWRRGARQIRLITHASDSNYDYLYYQEGEQCELETDLSPEILASRLRWLAE